MYRLLPSLNSSLQSIPSAPTHRVVKGKGKASWRVLGALAGTAVLMATLTACGGGDDDVVVSTATPAPSDTTPGSSGGTAPPSGSTATYKLNVTVTGPGNDVFGNDGRISSSDGKIDGCASATVGVCSASYGAGATVTLTAQAAPGRRFTGWNDVCGGGASSSATVTVSADRLCTATFDWQLPAQPQVVTTTAAVLTDARTGARWTPRGASWPKLEYACVYDIGTNLPTDSTVSLSMKMAASWGLNVARIPLNQDCWMGNDGAPVVGSSINTMADYRARVHSWVDSAHAAGLAVILDLHWSAPAGTLATDGQWPMADNQSANFWTSVAAEFKNDPSMMFELFNEPYGPQTWAQWRDGNATLPNKSDQMDDDTFPNAALVSYQSVGMQALVTAVRNAGAKQPLLLGGLNYASDLSGWLSYKPADPENQLVAAWHNYDGNTCLAQPCDGDWESKIKPVADVVPVVMTEFGYEASDSSYFLNAMNWADNNGIGYLPWAWWENPNDGTDYYLFTDNTFTTLSDEGVAFKQHLADLLGW
jgi:hypothetical protein